MAHPKFAIGSVRKFAKEDKDSEDNDKDEQAEVDEKCEKDDEIPDLNKSQRLTMVKGKFGTEDTKDEQEKQEKEMDDLWNEFAGRSTEPSGGKNQNVTQFLMIGDVLTVTVFPPLIMVQYDIFPARKEGP